MAAGSEAAAVRFDPMPDFSSIFLIMIIIIKSFPKRLALFIFAGNIDETNKMYERFNRKHKLEWGFDHEHSGNQSRARIYRHRRIAG